MTPYDDDAAARFYEDPKNRAPVGPAFRRITRDDGTIEMLEVVPREEFVCDFCGDEPSCEFPCANFSVQMAAGPEMRSEGAWCACTICADLIDAGHINDLTLRSIYKAEEKMGVKVPGTVKLITSAQHRKFAELHGPRQEIAP